MLTFHSKMEDTEMEPIKDADDDDETHLPSENAAAVVRADDDSCNLTVGATTGISVSDGNVLVSADNPISPTTAPDNINCGREGVRLLQLQPLRKHTTSRSKPESSSKSKRVWTDVEMGDADEAGTVEERVAFMRELEGFHRDNALEFKPPKFYGGLLNWLKLWRSVIKLGGYDVVTSSKLWRQVGESFHPPKTCTTVSWTFRIFYEKVLLAYERHKKQTGELQFPSSAQNLSAILEKEASGYQVSGSGRAIRDAAARAMQGWHAQRLPGYGEVCEPFTMDNNLSSTAKHGKPLKSIGLQHKTTNLEHLGKPANMEADKELDVEIVDIGPAADWVKINVRETKNSFEIHALVPGLLREELRVQSDPAGRLVITGQPEKLDNPWGITPFKKVVSLPARIDPLQTSAVVTLHGRLYVRLPFQQSPN